MEGLRLHHLYSHLCAPISIPFPIQHSSNRASKTRATQLLSILDSNFLNLYPESFDSGNIMSSFQDYHTVFHTICGCPIGMEAYCQGC